MTNLLLQITKISYSINSGIREDRSPKHVITLIMEKTKTKSISFPQRMPCSLIYKYLLDVVLGCIIFSCNLFSVFKKD